MATTWPRRCGLGALAIAMVVSAAVAAQDGPATAAKAESARDVTALTVAWWTVDGGGSTATGGAYRVSATLAQPDAGVSVASSVTLHGGYWHDASAGRLFGDGFESGSTDQWSAAVGVQP